MNIRTDLAIESIANLKSTSDILREERQIENIKITKIKINSEKSAKELGKPKGDYITVEFGKFMQSGEDFLAKEILRKQIKSLLPPFKSLLIVGVGNNFITSDSIGPKTAEKLLATRHIEKSFAKQIGLEGLKCVSVLAPGVLGQTGIEVGELVASAVNSVKADTVIVIDSLVAKDLCRLGSTVQISNTGLVPGSGVGNHRFPLTKETLGATVISIGVPTVVDSKTLVYELTGKTVENTAEMIITPKEIDTVVNRSCELLSYGINCAIQPKISPDIIMALV